MIQISGDIAIYRSEQFHIEMVGTSVRISYYAASKDNRGVLLPHVVEKANKLVAAIQALQELTK